MEEKLRDIGFSPDIESGIICRYKIHGIIVDIMPTNDSSAGFKNKWYPDGFNQAVDYQIDEKCKIKIFVYRHIRPISIYSKDVGFGCVFLQPRSLKRGTIAQLVRADRS